MHKLPGESSDTMIVNTEWGGFASVDALRPSCFGMTLDQASDKPGDAMFEKMISGMYLGELVRLALAHLHAQGAFMSDMACLPLSFAAPYSFQTARMSRIEGWVQSVLAVACPYSPCHALTEMSRPPWSKWQSVCKNILEFP
jgi:hexokinase